MSANRFRRTRIGRAEEEGAGTRELPSPPGVNDPQGWQQWWALVYLIYADALESYARCLLRRWGTGSVAGEESWDLVQGFFGEMMEKDGLRDAGRIRDLSAYVYTLFWRYVRGRYRRANARKRRPRGRLISLSVECVCIAAHEIQEDAVGVHAAIECALEVLHAQRPQYATVIEDLIHQDDGGRPSADLAGRLGVSGRALASLKYRARRRFGQLFYRTLRAAVRDVRLVKEICRRYMPWIPVLRTVSTTK